MHTGRTSCEYQGEDQGDVTPNQRTLRIASKSPEAGRKKWKRFSFIDNRGTYPAYTWISDLWLPDYDTITFLCVSHPLCGIS